MELDINQSETFQRGEWRMERIGWSLVTLFVLAGLVGLLGTGPLNSTSATSGAVSVENHRVAHYEADDSVRLASPPQPSKREP